MGIKPRRIQIVKGTSFRRNGAIHTQIIGPAGMENERQKLKEMLDRNLEGLAPTTVQALADITSSQADPPQNSEYDNDVIMAMGGEDGESWVDIPLMDQPESEVFMYAVREMLLNRSVHQRRRDDTRTQRQRLQSLDENWTSVLPQLVTAYLQWKSYSSATHDSQEVGESPYTFSIDVLDIYTLEKTARIVPAEDETSIAVALVSNGFLGTTPIRPSRAISLRTLELLRRLRRRQPSFSCEAFSRILCDYYEIPYRRTYRTTISNAFDIYLTILRHVDQMVQKALNQDTPDWRAKHACPPCGYVLKDEPPLRFSRMYCIDGNDSLKRMASTGTRDLADRRVFQDSDYFLPRAYVDKYAHEVKARRLSPEDVATKVTHDDPSSADGPATTNQTSNDDEDCEGLEEGDPTDGKSGDPALSGSLGPEFQRQKAKCIVNAFHGYSHGYSCQTRYHPNNTEGMGLSDLEDLERAFSSSNRLAPVIRHATPYRRHVAIECHLQQHDEDKYANLATLIYDNYVQALCLIADEGAALREAMEAFKLSEDDLRRFIEEEYTYVGNLGQEDPYDVHAVAYVEMLQEYQTLQSHFVDAHTHFLMSIPEDYAPQSSGKKSRVTRDISETQRREADRRFKAARLAELELQLAEMEVHMQITARWEPVILRTLKP
ncbi:hypothetical protein EUX98_g7960 [Antrodiella citrinella]|uniref:CxC1-like cysteine cluster associated with KDZ transposases domain-containing protein n=1 Tax=Antrodiella citrinella TaxID=2447956 RepID=A0A4S4MD33_9APHY|nr:hypothetical protein EUX98_g7960 [Antrodiella citrinella]